MNPRIAHSLRAAVAAAAILSVASAQSASQFAYSQAPCVKHTYVTESGQSAWVSSDGTTAYHPPCNSGAVCAQPNLCSKVPDGQQNPQPNWSDDDGRRDDDGDDSLIPILFGIGLIGTIVAIDELTGKDWVTSEQLDANGPRFPVRQKFGRFQTQGYAAAGWPFAVDLETEPGTSTWLEIRYKNSNAPPHVIDISAPNGGRRVEVIELPGTTGSVSVARYSLRSALVPEGRKPIYRTLKIYGIGAGPNAVGPLDALSAEGKSEYPAMLRGAASVAATAPFARLARPSGPGAKVASMWSAAALEFGTAAAAALAGSGTVGSYLSVVRFGPKYATRPADVSWAVAARSSFQRAQLEILQLPAKKKGKFTPVSRKDIDLLARPEASGSWAALPLLANVRAGTYQLQARAWRTRDGGGDWTGAFAPDYVYIR